MRPTRLELIKIDTPDIIDAVKDTRLTKEILKSVTRSAEGYVLNIRSEEAICRSKGR